VPGLDAKAPGGSIDHGAWAPTSAWRMARPAASR
jgi:hypothetical protein